VFFISTGERKKNALCPEGIPPDFPEGGVRRRAETKPCTGKERARKFCGRRGGNSVSVSRK